VESNQPPTKKNREQNPKLSIRFTHLSLLLSLVSSFRYGGSTPNDGDAPAPGRHRALERLDVRRAPLGPASSRRARPRGSAEASLGDRRRRGGRAPLGRRGRAGPHARGAGRRQAGALHVSARGQREREREAKREREREREKERALISLALITLSSLFLFFFFFSFRLTFSLSFSHPLPPLQHLDKTTQLPARSLHLRRRRHPPPERRQPFRSPAESGRFFRDARRVRGRLRQR